MSELIQPRAVTPRGFPYVVPADHPLEYPALSQQLAEAIENRGLLAANVVKTSDQTGIASGGAAGLTCTLNGLRVGAPVLGIFSLHAAVTSGGVPATAAMTPDALTGAVAVGDTRGRLGVTALNTMYHLVAFYLFTASAASMSTGVKVGWSPNGNAWACYTSSSITLISL